MMSGALAGLAMSLTLLGSTVNTFRVPVNTLYYLPMDEQLLRPQVPELDAILGAKIPVLDDGFVRVVDYMGDDAAIVPGRPRHRCWHQERASDDANADSLPYAAPHHQAVRDVPDKAPCSHADGLLDSMGQPSDRR